MSINNINDLELQLELLSGCPYKCTGCHVDRDNDHTVNIEKLLSVAGDFLKDMYPYAVVLGSTDVFTAKNAMSLLNDIRLTDLMCRFDRLVVNSTLLQIDHVILDRLAGLCKEFQVNIVIPESKLSNDKYTAVVKQHLDTILDKYPETIVHPQANLSESLTVDNYQAINDYYTERLGQGIDFNLSFARESSDPNVYRAKFEWLKAVSATTALETTGSLENVHLDVVIPTDKLEKAILYYDNAFYIVPIVYEDLVQTNDTFRFNSYQEYLKLRDTLTTAQWNSPPIVDCLSCQFNFRCVEHNVLSVMSEYDIVECPMPLETMYKLKR